MLPLKKPAELFSMLNGCFVCLLELSLGYLAMELLFLFPNIYFHMNCLLVEPLRTI